MAERFGVCATDALVRDVVEESLGAGDRAAVAALCGFFFAAGKYPGVLLSPLCVLASDGPVCRAFDGRARQPGLGARRPRGFTTEQEVPDAAYLAAPRSVAAASVALGYVGTTTWTRLVKLGIGAARQADDEARARALEAVMEQGGIAFSRAPFDRQLLLAGAPSAGGNLSREDLESVGEVDHEPERRETAAGSLSAFVGFDAASTAQEPAASPGTATLEALTVVDSRGDFAALGYVRATNGVAIPALGLVAPFAAAPVLRGVTRRAPGEVLGVRVSLGITHGADSRAIAVEAKLHRGADTTTLSIERVPETGAIRRRS